VGGDREVVEVATLDEVIAGIEEAWERGKLSLLMQHVRTDGKIEVYRDGEWAYSLTRSEFEEKTDQAFREYETISMRFEKPEEIGATEARARAEHLYKTRDGKEHRVNVTYAFRRYGRTWRVVGLDYEPPVKARAAAPEGVPGATALAPVPTPRPETGKALGNQPASPKHGEVSLVSAPPVRLRELLNAPRPRRLASVKRVRNGQRSLYTLQSMRGVAPGTVAWALYRQGEKRPLETGSTDVSALAAGGWVAVRTVAPQLMTLAAQGSTRSAARDGTRKVALLAERTFAETSLALVPVKPPAPAAVHTTKRHGVSHTSMPRARPR
jgi:hypothetical protein